MKWEKVDAYPEKQSDIYAQRRERARKIITEIYESGAELAVIEDTEREYPSPERMRIIFDEEARRVRRKIGFAVQLNVRGDKLYIRIERPVKPGEGKIEQIQKHSDRG